MLLEEGVCYDQCIFLAKLLLHSVLQGQICLLLQVFLDFLLLPSSPMSSVKLFSHLHELEGGRDHLDRKSTVTPAHSVGYSVGRKGT